jgi:hypothetical protein
VQSLRTSDGNPIRETVLCDEHADTVVGESMAFGEADQFHPDWDKASHLSRVDSVTANRQGLRCQICGSQECDPAD